MRMLIALLIAASCSVVGAHEGHHHDADKPVKLTGEVVDIACFIDHGGRGEKHASCAQKCLTAGNAVGLLVGQTLYVVVMSTHEPPNAKLAPYAGKRVEVTGTTTARNGIHVVDLESVVEAP